MANGPSTTVPDFRLLFESAPGLYLVLTPDLRIVGASDAYLAAAMRRREELLGRDIFDAFPDNPSDPAATGTRNLRDSLQRVLLNRVADSMAVQKYDIQRPPEQGGGFEERYWSPTNSPVLDERGEVRYILHRVQDVTEFVRLKQRDVEQRKLQSELQSRTEHMELEIYARAQEVQEANRRLRSANEELARLNLLTEERGREELRASERRFRALIEHCADAIALLDRDGKIVYGSPSTERVAGYPPEEFIGRLCFDLVHPEDLPTVQQALDEAGRRPSELIPATSRILHKDGSWRRFEGGVTNLLDDPSVAAIVVNYRDISERERLEEELRQSQKLEGVGRLASGIAHDFNNLLTALIGHANLLQEELPPQDPRQEHVRQIIEASERAAGLTGQLLAFARKQMIAPRIVHLNALLRRAEPLLRRLIREDITITVKLQEPLGAVRVDPGQMEQVLVNLVVNARDAQPRGGTITIETSNVQLDTQLDGLAPGEYVRLVVQDTGAGMDHEVRSHLFEPFYTTKEMGRGTGLGLATCYGIIKQCGGAILVQSEPGRGSAFSVYVPRAQDAAEASPTTAGAGPAPHGVETLLLAEDAAPVRRMLVDSLRRRGYRVLEAADGEEALRCAAEHNGPLDMLISDALMPGMSGRELAKRVRASRPGLKVLFISGYTEESLAQEQLSDPDISFLPKPFAPQALAQRVRELLAGHSDDTVIQPEDRA